MLHGHRKVKIDDLMLVF